MNELSTRVAGFFQKARPPVGSRPGTLAPPRGSPPPEVHVTQYTPDGVREERVDDLDALAAWVEPDVPTWIDVRGLGDEPTLRRIGEIFGLHPLALEDAVNVPQRAKSEIYADHHLLIARIPILHDDGSVSTPQVAFFIGRRHLLTFQERFFGFFEPVRERLRAGVGPIRSSGVDYLAYALVDTLVDGYYPIAEALTEELDNLEDQVMEDPENDPSAQIHRSRRRLVVLRRVGRPQAEAIRELQREDSEFVSAEVRTYLRDTLDHIAQIVELLESSHELSVSLMDIHLSNQGQRTNEVMKVLTLMASIFIPLTFIAGVYGMNFEYMPELRDPRAYPFVLATMVLVAVGMLAFFWRRG